MKKSIVNVYFILFTNFQFVQVLSEDGKPLPAGEIGAIAVKLPMPPGTLPTLWRNDERFVSSYMSTFEGYYETGDAGYMDEDGYLL